MIREKIVLYLGKMLLEKGTTIVKFEDIADYVYKGKPTDAVVQAIKDEVENMNLTVMKSHVTDVSGVYITPRVVLPWLVSILEVQVG